MNLEKNTHKMFTHDKHSAPSPESIELNTLYSFTISPSDIILNKTKELQDKITTFRDLIYENFAVYGVTYKLIPELSKTGRLHCHGSIKFVNNVGIALFYNSLFNIKHLITYEMDIVNDKDKWNNYCIKNSHIMQEFCKYNKIKYTIEH